MDLATLYAAIAAANLQYAADLRAAEASPPADRPARVEQLMSRHALEMATLDCSSVPPCPPAPTGSGRCATVPVREGIGVPDGAVVAFGGARWAAQSASGSTGAPAQSLRLDRDGQVVVTARSGEHPWFDPPRKFRAEFCGLDRFPKGAPMRLRFSFLIEPATNLAGLDWAFLAQIHQADMHYSDASFVPASPIFALDLVPAPGGDAIEVRTGSEAGPLREPDIDPATGRQRVGPGGPRWREHFPYQKVVGRSPALARDRWHAVDFTVVDGHGGPGRVAVKVDGTPVVDLPSVPIGYGYVDALARVPFAGGPQNTGSYLKLGVYAGLSASEGPPPNVAALIRYKDVRVGP